MKTNALGRTTVHLAEGQEPTGLPEGVVLEGPGAAPIHEALQARLAAARGVPQAVADLDALDEVLEASRVPAPPGDADDDAPADYGAYPIRVLRDLCRERDLSPSGAKADLVARLAAHDQEHAELP